MSHLYLFWLKFVSRMWSLIFLKSNLSHSLGLGLAPGIVDVAEVALMIVGLAPPLIGGSICVCSDLFAFVCYCYSVVWTNLHLCCTIVTQVVFKNTESIVVYFKKKNHWAFPFTFYDQIQCV